MNLDDSILNVSTFLKINFTFTDYELDPGVRQYEQVLDSFEGVIKEAGDLLKTQKNIVKVRHYSFIDLERFGYEWTPDWFSLIRDPIKKVQGDQNQNLFQK